MSSPESTPSLDDVMETTESAPEDHTQHAKDPHVADEVLQHRTEQERQAVGSDDAAPGAR